MASVNKVIIVGNLGADPEVRTFQNGGKLVTIRVATTEQWNDRQSGEKRNITDWHTIVFNGKLADAAERYLRKGAAVYVEGKLRTRSWEDQNGQKRYITEIRADEMKMLGGRGDGQRSGAAPAQRRAARPAPQQEDWGGVPDEQPYNAEPPPQDTYDDVPFDDMPF